MALAKKQFEDDRNAVKDRTERERLARLARAQVEAKMAEDAAALEEQEQRVEEVDDGIWGDGQKLGS